MSNFKLPKYLLSAFIVLILWLGIRFLLPIALPFLFAWLLALAAEPAVRFFNQRLRLPRLAASLVSVTLALGIAAGLIFFLCAALLRELGKLAGILPDMEFAVLSGLETLENWLLDLSDRSPESLQPVLNRGVSELFSGGSAVLDRVTTTLLDLASSVFKAIPGSALSLGTWVLAAYMISVRLPQIHAFFCTGLPNAWYDQYLPTLRSLKKAISGWLIAQLKLSAVTLALLMISFFLLRIPNGPLWALIVCFVDILPVLGTGTVLIPWAFLCLLQQQQLRAIGLLALYGVISLTRSVLEPRLIGKQLGLDPLVTLVALYVGFRLWGLPGMLVAPLLAVAATKLALLP